MAFAEYSCPEGNGPTTEEELQNAMATPIGEAEEGAPQRGPLAPEVPVVAAEIYPGIESVPSSDPFWSKDPTVLLRPDRLMEFFPAPAFSTAERLNAIARFGIYIGLAISLYKRSPKYLYITAGVLLVTQFIFVNGSDTGGRDRREPFANYQSGPEMVTPTQQGPPKPSGPFTYPTTDNPFMNVTLADYQEDPTRGRAVPYGENNATSQGISKDIDQKYYAGLFRDSTDIFGRDGGERQFYTMPATTIPNDRESFAKWCYGDMPSCKDQPENCFKYSDVRQHSSYFPPAPPEE